MPRTRFLPYAVPTTSGAAFLAVAAVHFTAATVLGRDRRTPDTVRANYDAERGARLVADLPTLDVYALEDPTDTDWRLINDKVAYGPIRDARAATLEVLESELKPWLGGRVVEFGSGDGRNLIWLASRHSGTFTGLELSPASVQLAERAAAHYGTDVAFRVVNACTPSLDVPDADVAFSAHALEQMPEIFPAAVDNMLRCAPNVVFLEPEPSMYPRSIRGVTSRLRARRMNRLQGLADYLRARGVLVEARRLGVNSNPLNESCVLIARRG